MLQLDRHRPGVVAGLERRGLLLLARRLCRGHCERMVCLDWEADDVLQGREALEDCLTYGEPAFRALLLAARSIELGADDVGHEHPSRRQPVVGQVARPRDAD